MDVQFPPTAFSFSVSYSSPLNKKKREIYISLIKKFTYHQVLNKFGWKDPWILSHKIKINKAGKPYTLAEIIPSQDLTLILLEAFMWLRYQSGRNSWRKLLQSF